MIKSTMSSVKKFLNYFIFGIIWEDPCKLETSFGQMFEILHHNIFSSECMTNIAPYYNPKCMTNIAPSYNAECIKI